MATAYPPPEPHRHDTGDRHDRPVHARDPPAGCRRPAGPARSGRSAGYRRGHHVRDPAGHRRSGRDARAGPGRIAGWRPPPPRGCPGPGQDAHDQDPGRCPRRLVQAHPVHARPHALRSRRDADLPPRPGRLRGRARPRLRELPARRRDQPCPGQGPVGPARGHAGAPGHDRPRHVQGADPVPRPGHREPDRSRGHIPAARGPGRPVHAQDPARLPEPGRRGADRPPLAGRSGRAARDPRRRRPAPAAARGHRRVRRSAAHQLCRGARRGDPQAHLLGRARARDLRVLRRQPARLDQPHPRRPGDGPAPRQALRPAIRHRRARSGRPAPPAGHELLRAGRGRHPGHHRQPRPHAVPTPRLELAMEPTA